MVLYRQKIERFVKIGCYIGVESLQRRETTIPNPTPSEEPYRFGADGNMRLCISTHWLPPQPNDFCKKSTRVGLNAHPGSGGLWAG